MNRKPQEADCLNRVRGRDCNDAKCRYHTHERTCGGAYVKTREPEARPKAGGAKGKRGRRGAVALTNAPGTEADTRSLHDVFRDFEKQAPAAGPAGGGDRQRDSAQAAGSAAQRARCASPPAAGPRDAQPASKKRARAVSSATAAPASANALAGGALSAAFARSKDKARQVAHQSGTQTAERACDPVRAPQAAAAGGGPREVICIDSDSEEERDVRPAPQPSPARRNSSQSTRRHQPQQRSFIHERECARSRDTADGVSTAQATGSLKGQADRVSSSVGKRVRER